MAITKSTVAAGTSLLTIIYGFWAIGFTLANSGSPDSLSGGEQFKLVGIVIAGMLINNFIANIFQAYATAHQWSIDARKVGQHTIMSVVFLIASKVSISFIKSRLYS